MALKWLVVCIILNTVFNVEPAVKTVCEHDTLNLACPENHKLHINEVLYGRRTPKDDCGSGKSNCRASNSLQTARNRCEGRRKCSVPSSNSVFGDPCPGTQKYLKVDYNCIADYPCKEYIEDTDTASWQRSTGYIIPILSKTSKSDRRGFVSGWYRFTSPAGGEMPTTCPPARACGAKYPVWLEGGNPKSVGENKTLKACVRVNIDCCANSWSVDVKKCAEENGKEFFVYKLKPTVGNDMSYCAGKESKCPSGEVSTTGFTPCSSKFPTLKGDPKVTVDVANKRMRFKCTFDANDKNSENVRHEVVWYTGPPEKEIDKEILKGNRNEAYLQNTNKYGQKPKFCLNKNIYCAVRSYYVGKEQFASTRRSNSFYAGLVIDPEEVEISENGKPTKVKITTTVPIVCQDGTESCSVQLEVAQTKKDSFVDYCTLKFKPGPAGRSIEMEVVAKRDNVDDGDQSMKIKLFMPDHVDPVDWNCYENITDITVITKDVTTSTCRSTGDPHLKTFDGTYYNHYHVGDYMFIKSDARLFRVHIRTFRCHTVSCNCGVAAREGDDVLVVDMCRDNVPRARYASTVQPQKGTSIERSANGKVFVFNFPSGAKVRFSARRWFGRWHLADVNVQVPSDDFGKTKGLCGTWDKNKNNDLQAKDKTVHGVSRFRKIGDTKFTESWKLNRDESLFYHEGGPRKCEAERVKSYCTCSEDCCGKTRRVNCDFEGYSTRPKYMQALKGYKKLDFPGAEHCGKKRRKRRDTEQTIILPDDGRSAIYAYNPDQPNFKIDEFPTPKGTTLVQAQSKCEDALRNSEIGKVCLKTIVGFNITDLVDQCVVDIQILDDFEVATGSAVDSLKEVCEEITLREVNKYWKKDQSGELQPPQEIGDSACPNECSGSGKCLNGTCACDDGFLSSDCSIRKGEAPELIGVPFNGLCDIRNQDCLRTRVVGYNFVDSPDLLCRTRQVKISDKPYTETGQVDISVAELLSFAELSCEVPRVPVDIQYGKAAGVPAGGFLIQLSNDGENFSHNSSLFLVYDSKCMQCTTNGSRTCKWKDNTCKINNYCFAKDDANPTDWCQVCDPARSNNSFVKRLVNKAPEFNLTASPLKIFKGQKWRYELPVKDPESQQMSFDFIGDSPDGMEISSVGVVTWIPQEVNKTYEVTIKATDPCGESATGRFNVKTSRCFCEGNNGGYCVWESNVSKCKCPHDGCLEPTCVVAKEARVCKILAGKSAEGKEKNSSGTVAVVVVVVLLLMLAGVFGAVFFLHKQGIVQVPFLPPNNKSKAEKSDQETSNGRTVPRAVNDYEKRLEERKNHAFVEED